MEMIKNNKDLISQLGSIKDQALDQLKSPLSDDIWKGDIEAVNICITMMDVLYNAICYMIDDERDKEYIEDYLGITAEELFIMCGSSLED